jgi:HD-GYP domain-containing protein (c-di-GMP phosphodiesterase class II)
LPISPEKYVKTLLDIEENQFRPINTEFLQEEVDEVFDIYYKTSVFGNQKFVKFASNHPSHQNKVRQLIDSGEYTEFFIRQDDLIKYYHQATEQLRILISDPAISLLDKTQKLYDVSKDIMKNFFEFSGSEKVLHSSGNVMGLMDQCLSEGQARFNTISEIMNKNYYIYTHSLNVGLYCMVYGINDKMSATDVRSLGLGGMLHDIGKARLDSSILEKKGPLSKDELKIVETHPRLGQEIMESMQCYATNVIRMAGQHHENFKGRGYPNDLDGKDITLFARICKIMDIYDGLTTHRPNKKAVKPFEALIIMKNQMMDELDPAILGKFIRYMGPSKS